MSSKRSFRSGGATGIPAPPSNASCPTRRHECRWPARPPDHFEMAHMVHRVRSVQLNRDQEVTARRKEAQDLGNGLLDIAGPDDIPARPTRPCPGTTTPGRWSTSSKNPPPAAAGCWSGGPSTAACWKAEKVPNEGHRPKRNGFPS